MTDRLSRQMFSRRCFCSALAGFSVSAFPISQSFAGYCRDAPRSGGRRALAETPLGLVNERVLWGAHLEGAAIYDARFIEALKNEKPTVIALGSGLKFGNLHPLSMAFERMWEGRSYPTWTECDDVVSLAASLGAPVRGDSLIWNDWVPAWVTDIAERRPNGWRDTLQAAFERHFETIFEHFNAIDTKFKKRMMPWCGVVNEPFEPWGARDGKPAWRTGAWLSAFEARADGVPGYIHKAFEYAERHAGAVRPAFYLNEAGCESDRFGPILRPAMLNLVDSLQKAGRKIDAVGLESHLNPAWMNDPLHPDWGGLVKFLEALAARGLEIYVTELDVIDCSLRDMDERDRLVADYTGSFVAAALDAGVTMVTDWDFSDKYSWLRESGAPTATFETLEKWANCTAKPACPRPTIYDEALYPKPARRALAEALAARRR